MVNKKVLTTGYALMLQCFVVCPFGSSDGSKEAKRLFAELEGLRRYVFGPAEEACLGRGYPVKISDSREIDHGCNEIKSAVQKCLDDAVAVVIVLSADKPNVYLEMGWAHGLWHALILLASDRYTIPVDINNDLRLIFTAAHVDGRDESGAKALAIKLADAIVARVEKGRTVKQIGHWPKTTLARGAVNVYGRFLDAISPHEWSAMIGEAKSEIIIGSTGMSRIREQAFYMDDPQGKQTRTTLGNLLLAKALDGVKVTVLFYHEDNVTKGHLKRSKTHIGKVHDDLRESFIVWSTQRRSFETLTTRQGTSARGSFRVIQIRQHHLPFRITLTEQRVLATLRLYTEMYNSGLCIDALSPKERIEQSTSLSSTQINVPFYTQIKEELDHIIAINSENSEEDYQKWLQEAS